MTLILTLRDYETHAQTSLVQRERDWAREWVEGHGSFTYQLTLSRIEMTRHCILPPGVCESWVKWKRAKSFLAECVEKAAAWVEN